MNKLTYRLRCSGS